MLDSLVERPQRNTTPFHEHAVTQLNRGIWFGRDLELQLQVINRTKRPEDAPLIGRLRTELEACRRWNAFFYRAVRETPQASRAELIMRRLQTSTAPLT